MWRPRTFVIANWKRLCVGSQRSIKRPYWKNEKFSVSVEKKRFSMSQTHNARKLFQILDEFGAPLSSARFVTIWLKMIEEIFLFAFSKILLVFTRASPISLLTWSNSSSSSLQRFRPSATSRSNNWALLCFSVNSRSKSLKFEREKLLCFARSFFHRRLTLCNQLICPFSRLILRHASPFVLFELGGREDFVVPVLNLFCRFVVVDRSNRIRRWILSSVSLLLLSNVDILSSKPNTITFRWFCSIKKKETTALKLSSRFHSWLQLLSFIFSQSWKTAWIISSPNRTWHIFTSRNIFVEQTYSIRDITITSARTCHNLRVLTSRHENSKISWTGTERPETAELGYTNFCHRNLDNVKIIGAILVKLIHWFR